MPDNRPTFLKKKAEGEAKEAEQVAKMVGGPPGGGPPDDYDLVASVITHVFNQKHPKYEDAHQAVQKAKAERRIREQRLADAHKAEDFAKKDYQGEKVKDDHHAPLPRQWAIAGVALIPEWYTCYLAAEALGGGRISTAIFATVLLAVLAGCEYWYDSAVRHRHLTQKRAALGILIATIATLGALRFYFGWVVFQHSLLGALGVAAALIVVTAALVGISLAALRLSESIPAWQHRLVYKKAVRARRTAEADLAQAREDQARATNQYEQLINSVVTATVATLHMNEGRLRNALERNLAQDPVG